MQVETLVVSLHLDDAVMSCGELIVVAVDGRDRLRR